MKRMTAELLKLTMVLGAGAMLSGFTAGGCGGVETPRCETFTEQQCNADPVCAPEYVGAGCACACAPGAKCPPCECPAPGFSGCHLRPAPPSDCAGLSELSCLQHPGCVPVYGGSDDEVLGTSGNTRAEAKKSGHTPVDGAGCMPPPPAQGFLSCEPARPSCPAMMCDLACTTGMKHDANGCETCACEERSCTTDQDCESGEACLMLEVDSASVNCGQNGTACPTRAPLGICNKVSRDCNADTDCSAGQRCTFPQVTCPPDAFCAPSRGSCTATPCTTDKECAGGTTCQADPTDPCSQPGVTCAQYAPVQTVCLPATTPATRCNGLDEKSCSSSGCQAVFGASACAPDGTCTPDMVFKRCE